MDYFAGIDAGSTYVKAAIMDNERALRGCKVAFTGIDARATSKKILEELCSQSGISVSDINAIVSTGYSRRRIDIAHGNVTEIKAHAAGAVWAAPEGCRVRTIIDIGGQDSKVIVIGAQGETVHFVMNDKCAAGTGRFLEALARVLELCVEDIGPLSRRSKRPCRINSTCAVFAESEVISLLARGMRPEDIIAGIHESMAKRIGGMARKAHFEPDILITGGGALNPGLVAAFEDELLAEILVPKYPQCNGAVGAALIAANR
jgi:predicted CoA-substrate-specific enzyme activase